MMTLRELLAGVAVREAEADLDLEISGVSYDSRKTRPGDLFVAMTGYATDGHKFIPMAREKGAACVLCQEKPEGEGPWVLVEDSRAALAQVGRNWYGDPAASMTMVGVTGTNGKTTTTYLLKDILEQAAGAKVGLIGTNQNMIGGEILPTERTTPESFELQGLLRRMADEGCTHVVMEVSSHALYLKRVAGILFAVGIFTNLTQDHLDFHGTMENYCDAKALLFRVCDVGVCNGDDPWAGRLMASATCRQVFFGQGADRSLDLRAENVRLDEAGVSFDAVAAGEAVPVRVEIPGGFMVYNTLGVLAAARELGVPLADSARVLSHSAHVKGRVEPVPVPGDYTVLIDYAHTPTPWRTCSPPSGASPGAGWWPSSAAAGTGIRPSGPRWGPSPPAWRTLWWSPPTTPAPRSPGTSSGTFWRGWKTRRRLIWWWRTGRRPSAGPWTTPSRGM